MTDDQAVDARGFLGSLEHEAMVALWMSSPASVATVRARINDRRADDTRLAYTTVMTVLARLYDKGLVSRTRRGRAYDYTPMFDEVQLVEHLSRRDVDGLLERYGGPILLAQFAAAVEQADPQLLDQLRALVQRDKDA